jgi:YfiR/HmsC-like
MTRACALVLLSLLALSRAGAAEVDRALEQRVKAAYLLRFTEFVTWPDDSWPAHDAPLVIAVAGPAGLAAELAELAAAGTATGRRVEVRRTPDPSPALGSAHVLFVPAQERARFGQFIRAAGTRTLIVTEHDGALTQGSVINFVLAEGRVRFEVAIDSAEKRGLRLSARMLAVAHAVRGTP